MFQKSYLNIIFKELHNLKAEDKTSTVSVLHSLADRVKKILKELDIKNVKVIVGDGSKGLEEYSPYDGIIVTAGSPEIPESLIKQLNEKGRMVIPVGNSFSQDLLLGIKKKGKLKISPICNITFLMFNA